MFMELSLSLKDGLIVMVLVIISVIVIIIFRLKQSIFLAMINAVKHPTLLVELQRTEGDKTNTLFTLKAPLI